MKRMAAALGAGMLVALLAGCVPMIPNVPGDGNPASGRNGGVAPRDESQPTPESPIAPPRDVRCGDGQDVTLDAQGRTFMVTGQCGTVNLKGQALTVTVDHADGVTISGQAIVVKVGDAVGGLQMNGNANAVQTGDLGAISVSGQGNQITAKALGALSISGTDNTVTGDTDPTTSDVNGQGNVVRRS